MYSEFEVRQEERWSCVDLYLKVMKNLFALFKRTFKIMNRTFTDSSD